MKTVILIWVGLILFSVTSSTAAVNLRNGYAGEFITDGSQLIFLRARFLEKETGRFLSKDPLGLIDGFNRYAYCGADPVNCSDREGTYVETLWDAANVSLGVINAYENFSEGKWGWGLLDVVGVVYDGVATAVPILPGFAGAALRARRAGSVIDAAALKQIANKALTDPNVVKFRNKASTFGKRAHDKVEDYLVGIVASPDFRTSISKAWLKYRGFKSAFRNGVAGPDLSRKNLAWVDLTTDNARTWQKHLDLYPGDAVGVLYNRMKGEVVETGYRFSRSDGFKSGASTILGVAQHWVSDPLSAVLRDNVGGVLLDYAAELVGGELKAAAFDFASGQLVFLGNEQEAFLGEIDLDFYYTAIQAVYGSSVPPFVSLEPAAVQTGLWTDSDGDGALEPGETGGFPFSYQTLWPDEGGTVELRLVFQDFANNEIHDVVVPLQITPSPIMAWPDGATASIETLVLQPNSLYHGGWHDAPVANALPPGIALDEAPFVNVSNTNVESYPFDHVRNQNGSVTNDYVLTLSNTGSRTYGIITAAVVPSKQHRVFGGRVDGTRMGWVMYEADRIMKCLAVGHDPLTDTDYSSGTLAVPGYQNLLERAAGDASRANGNIRMWFVPEEMTLKRHVDSATGQAAIIWDTSKVALLTESSLEAVAASPVAAEFVNHFTDHYADFAAMEFPVIDPDDPTGQNLINVKIFDMLEDVMQAVSLARFLRDNGIPLDMWWLNSWTPPTAFSPRSVPTAQVESYEDFTRFLIHGGVDIPTPNAYVPSVSAANVANLVLTARPDDPENPESDLDAQSWEVNGTSEGDLTAVAATTAPEPQDGNIVLGEVDLAAASAGELPLAFSRYYQSSYLGKEDLGPGWRTARFQLEFSRPSWFDDTSQGLMKDSNNQPVPRFSNGDTGLRSGVIRVVDLASGGFLEFESSLVLDYGVDSLLNPVIILDGLKPDGTPEFIPGPYQDDRATLEQDTATRNYVFTSADGAVVEFDYEGRVRFTRDRRGVQQDYLYDNVWRQLQRIEDSEGQKIEFAYDPNSRKLTGATLTMHNAPHAPVIESVTYDYHTEGDQAGCLQTVTDTRSGQSVTYSYNEHCQLVQKEYFNGLNEFVTSVDLRGRAEEAEDSRGNLVQSTFTRDEATGDRITITSDPLIDPLSGFLPAETRFDPNGRLLSNRSVTGAEVSYGYDGADPWPNQITLPIEGRAPIQIERDALGNPTTITDPSNEGALPVEIVYNGDHLPEDIFDEAGRKTEVRYTPLGDVDYVRRYHNGNPVTVSYGYNATTGYLETITNAENETVTIGRDSKGRVTSVEDATGVRMEYDYDAYGRLWKVHDPRMVDPIEYLYDDAGRVAQVIAATGTTGYAYDPATGFLSSVTDSQGRRTRYSYFANGDVHRVTLEKMAADGVTVEEVLNQTDFDYDRFGNLTMVDPQDAAPIYFTTDEIGRSTGSYEVDNRAPGPPKALDSNHADDGVWTNHTDHDFVWGAPESDSGIEGYSFALDSEPDEVIDVPNGAASVVGVSEGQHVFRVKGKTNDVPSGDAFVSFWGSEARFDLWVDTTDPEITGWTLTPPDVTKETSGTVDVGISAVDNLSGIDPENPPRLRYALVADGGPVAWTTWQPMMEGAAAGNWLGAISEDWNAEKGKVLRYQVELEDRAGNLISGEQSESIEAGKAPFLFYTK